MSLLEVIPSLNAVECAFPYYAPKTDVRSADQTNGQCTSTIGSLLNATQFNYMDTRLWIGLISSICVIIIGK